MYAIECDACGKDMVYQDGTQMTFESEEQARNVARAFDWIAVGDKDYCPCLEERRAIEGREDIEPQPFCNEWPGCQEENNEY